MKNMIIPVVALLLTTTTVTSSKGAIKTENFAVRTTSVYDQGKKIKPEDLPEAVKKTLASDEYADWKVESAEWIQKDGEGYYSIKLSEGDKQEVVNLDKSGKEVESKENEQDNDGND